MESRLTLRYPFPFIGDIQATVTQNPATVTDWLTHVKYAYLAPPTVDPSYFAFPEIRPKIIYLAVWPEGPFMIPPHLLQILVPGHCLFFHLAYPLPDSLRVFLMDRLYQFVGSEVNSALSRLQIFYGADGYAIRGLLLSHYRYWPIFPREFELRVQCPHPYSGWIVATLTHTPAIVTQWITIIDAYLSLPDVQPKIIFLTAFPEQCDERPRVLQILVAHHCLFFDLHHAPSQMPDLLRQFLDNRPYTFVGSNVWSALARLCRYFRIGGNATWRVQQNTFSNSLPHPVDWMLREDDIARYCRHSFLHYKTTV